MMSVAHRTALTDQKKNQKTPDKSKWHGDAPLRKKSGQLKPAVRGPFLSATNTSPRTQLLMGAGLSA